jgi:hypothetical protein
MGLLLFALALFLLPFCARHKGNEREEPPAVPHTTTQLRQYSASNDVQRLRLALGNFLLAVKDPYRPPLGDNRDITRALTGGNRRGLALVPTNDPALRDGQLVDPWGTPYWFHARAPDAIDIVSAGPDRKLFTGDDIGTRRAQ